MDTIRSHTVREMLEKSCRRYEKLTAFIVREGREQRAITYEIFGRDTEALSLMLSEDKSEKLGIMGANCYGWCLGYLAALFCGKVAVPLDRELSGEQALALLDFSDTRTVLCDRRSAQRLRAADTEGRLRIIGFEAEEGEHIGELILRGRERTGRGETAVSPMDCDKLAVLLFTSGTTGRPKGVMLSNRNIVSDLKAVSSLVDISRQDRSLSVLPLHHTYETITMLMMIKNGGTVCFCESYRNLIRDLRELQPTVIALVPLILEKLARRIEGEMKRSLKGGKRQLAGVMSSVMHQQSRRRLYSALHDSLGGRLSRIIVGAAPVSRELAETFEGYGFSVIIGYGLTECSPIVICNSDYDRRSDSIGRPVATAQVRIADADESGVGEIQVKGPMVMLGYYKDKQATSQVLKNGWLSTGDMGYCDSKGYYYITGRRKNIILTAAGKNIYPEELEAMLLKSPLVAECIVYQRDSDIVAQILPDGEELLAKSKKSATNEADAELYIGAVVKTVNRRLPHYKRIKSFEIRDREFEKTSSRKIKR